jgi:hypothetical protein
MDNKMNTFRILGLICLSVFFCNANAEDLPELEKPPVVKISDLFPPELAVGPNYSLQQNVPTDGYFGNFVLQTEWGTLQVRGSELLKVRISEMPAIQSLDEISKTEVFAKAAASAAVKPIKSLQKAAEDPVDTVKGIPSGVGRFFKRTAKAVEKGVSSVKKSEDNAQTQENSSSGEALKEIAGYNKIVREWAKNLQVDPYTTNPILKKELESVARASFAGGFTTKVAIPSAPRPVSTVIRVSNLVWDLPPEDLEALNERKLKTMGVSEEAIKSFLKNPNFTPTTATAFVLSLEELKGVSGIGSAIAAATKAESEEEAHFFVGSAAILAKYHHKSPIASVTTTGLVITGRTSDGKLIVPAALDYVSWTDEIAEFATREELKGREKWILLSGKFSTSAKKAFTVLGWQLQENLL